MQTFKYYLYRFKWWLADTGRMTFDVPINLDIELAGKCQLACTMCPFGTGAFSENMQGMMPRKMAEDLLIEAARIGIKSIKMNFRGEPGLSKDLESLISFAKALGFAEVFINSNMLAFNDKRLKALADSGLDKLIVSVDGASEETYEFIRVGGDFKKLVKNINLFNKYRKETKLIIQMVVMDSNRHEVEKIKKLGADEYRFVQVQDRGAGEGVTIKERRRCPQPFQRLVVGWDGTIFPCCSNWNNEYPLGNYKTMSLLEAWNSSKMSTLRHIQNQNTLADNFPCKNCQVKGSYK